MELRVLLAPFVEGVESVTKPATGYQFKGRTSEVVKDVD